MSVVLTEVADRILTVTVNRPEKLNALNAEVLAALDAAFASAKTDPSVGGVLLTGAGEKAFVAGADIAEFRGLSPEAAHAASRRGQAVFARIESLGKPVLAAVNGFALGGGCELAMAATFRYASKNARFGQPEVNLGLLPGYGGTQRLPRLVGRGRAMELLLTGDAISADEALRIGLVNRVLEPAELLPAGRETLKKILAKAPLAVSFVLDAVHAGLDRTLADGAEYEAGHFGRAFGTEDMKEGVAAFLEKRPAKFTGR